MKNSGGGRRQRKGRRKGWRKREPYHGVLAIAPFASYLVQVAVAHPAILDRYFHVSGPESASFDLKLGKDATFVLGGDGETFA